MFLKRLTWFWILLTGIALVLIGRLIDIQVVHADDWGDLAARIWTEQTTYLQAPRGSILDRNGRLLVSDEPTSDVSVHYAVLTGRSGSYLRAVARNLRKSDEFAGMKLDEILAQLHHDISDMWQRLSELSGRPVSEFIERGERVRDQVDRIRAARRKRAGTDEPVREEGWFYPVIGDVSDDVALAVRLELERRPWLRVVPSSRRVVHDADSVVHLLGNMGAVSPEHLASDAYVDDDLRKLHPDDRCGTSGVELLAEPMLRGTRGRLVKEIDGSVIDRVEPVPGENVKLTIDMDLQDYILERLGKAVAEWPPANGASAVVIDVATREVLALVSYPIYSRDRFAEDFEQLRRDAIHTPLRFRAVGSIYPPGSTCKAITLIGALSEGLTTEHERIHCTGHLLPDQPNMFRCWIYNRFHITHDGENPDGLTGEDAIRNSCNIYFFKMGGRLGPQRLCEWFSRLGLGRTTGTGLIEESPGIVPTEQAIHRPYQASDPWNFAIGQGEVSATPIQVANVGASIAAGYWAPVHLLRQPASSSSPSADRQAGPRFNADALRVLRTGMWRVVNERGGTGHDAKLDAESYVLCGKTGSAEAQPIPTAYTYTFEWPDGHREQTVAYLEEDAVAQLGARGATRVGKYVAQRYPPSEPGDSLPSHAWFMGYTQPASTPRGATPTGRVYAISVVIEYAGSGGHAAGPVIKDIADWLLARDD